MNTVDGAGVTGGAYPVSSPAEDAGSQTRSVSTQGVESGGIELALEGADSRMTGAASSSVVTGERLLDAVVKVVVALVDLVMTAITHANTAKGDEARKAEAAKPKAPVSSKPTSTTQTTTATAKPTAGATARRLEAIQDDRGVVTVRTHDGYTIKAEGREEAWTISAPDGKATRIFGDPHVKESDGDRWDFKQRSSFVFGANKITVETVPVKGGNTVSGKITVYSGSERVTIGGIDRNRPTILALAGDARQHDDALSDGTIFTRGTTSKGESWSFLQNGKRKIMGAK